MQIPLRAIRYSIGGRLYAIFALSNQCSDMGTQLVKRRYARDTHAAEVAGHRAELLGPPPHRARWVRGKGKLLCNKY